MFPLFFEYIVLYLRKTLIMKTLSPLLLIVLLLVTACGPTKEQAISFNDDLVDLQKELLASQNSFIDVFAEGSTDDLIEESENWKATAKELKSKAEEMGAIDDVDEMRSSFINLCDAHLEIINDKLPRFFEIIEKSEDLSMSDENFDNLNEEMMTLKEEIDGINDGANQKFLESQEDFASRYDFTLN